MCLYPTLIRNKKYQANIKNGGNVPPIKDPRTIWIPVGCQNCKECRDQKKREWQIRLQEDIKTYTNGKFVTLTFSNKQYTKLSQHEKIKNLEGYDRDNAIATQATRYFLERYRKKYKKSIRHWLVTELGHSGTENIHLHGIIWTDHPLQTIEEIWQYGYMWKGKPHRNKIINYVSPKTVNYIIKYITKQDEIHKAYKSIILTSPGIGNNYTNTYNATKNTYAEKDTNNLYRTSTGHKMAMPIYWRNKLYTEQQREELWIQQLDKKQRWICGQKIDISKNLETYNNILKYERQKYKQLGYGSGNIKWQQTLYETQLRNINHLNRIK